MSVIFSVPVRDLTDSELVVGELSSKLRPLPSRPVFAASRQPTDAR